MIADDACDRCAAHPRISLGNPLCGCCYMGMSIEESIFIAKVERQVTEALSNVHRSTAEQVAYHVQRLAPAVRLMIERTLLRGCADDLAATHGPADVAALVERWRRRAAGRP